MPMPPAIKASLRFRLQGEAARQLRRDDAVAGLQLRQATLEGAALRHEFHAKPDIVDRGR